MRTSFTSIEWPRPTLPVSANFPKLKGGCLLQFYIWWPTKFSFHESNVYHMQYSCRHAPTLELMGYKQPLHHSPPKRWDATHTRIQSKIHDILQHGEVASLANMHERSLPQDLFKSTRSCLLLLFSSRLQGPGRSGCGGVTKPHPQHMHGGGQGCHRHSFSTQRQSMVRTLAGQLW